MKVEDIQTETFNRIIKDLLSDGWHKVDEYDKNNFDAWIDYGMVILQKQDRKLKFEWDNWFEGTVEGSDHVIQDIIGKYNLKK